MEVLALDRKFWGLGGFGGAFQDLKVRTDIFLLDLDRKQNVNFKITYQGNFITV
jgi:hypothetical protein